MVRRTWAAHTATIAPVLLEDEAPLRLTVEGGDTCPGPVVQDVAGGNGLDERLPCARIGADGRAETFGEGVPARSGAASTVTPGGHPVPGGERGADREVAGSRHRQVPGSHQGHQLAAEALLELGNPTGRLTPQVVLREPLGPCRPRIAAHLTR